VYDHRTVRDGIYLPKGIWVDYWTGQRHEGPGWLDNYPAPLDRLPLFVKAGSIVPIWPEGTLSWETRDRSRLDLDVYPEGETEFVLYEDDGVTQAYRRGAHSRQTFTATVHRSGVEVTIGPAAGSYDGQPEGRSYLVQVHRAEGPTAVTVDNPQDGQGRTPLEARRSREALAAADRGWYHAPGLGGVTLVKTPPVPARGSLTLRLAAEQPATAAPA
jgi:hypothetical protein